MKSGRTAAWRIEHRRNNAEECSKLTNRMVGTAIPPGRRPSALAESQNGTRDQGFAVAAQLGAPFSAPCRSAGPMIATGGSDGMVAERLNYLW